MIFELTLKRIQTIFSGHLFGNHMCPLYKGLAVCRGSRSSHLFEFWKVGNFKAILTFVFSNFQQQSYVLMFCKNGVMFWTVRCSVKKVFLEILQNSQENICVRVSFLMKIQAYEACNFIKERDTVTGVFLWIFQNF